MVPLIDLFASFDDGDPDTGPYFDRAGGFNKETSYSGIPFAGDLDDDGVFDRIVDEAGNILEQDADINDDGIDNPAGYLARANAIPYPGRDPRYPSALNGAAKQHMAWHHNLGEGCKTNEGGELGLGSAKFVSMDSKGKFTLNILPGSYIEESIVNGFQKRISSGGSGGGAFHAGQGYYYPNSYWMDIASAYVQTMSLTQYVWADHIDGYYKDDPRRGVPTYWERVLQSDPIERTFPQEYFDLPAPGQPTRSSMGTYPLGRLPTIDAPGFALETPCRDLDVDGDGKPDVPSTFDTMAEVDAQFLRNLGEWPEDYATGTRPTLANVGLETVGIMSQWNGNKILWGEGNAMPILRYKPLPDHYNIKGQLALYLEDADDPAIPIADRRGITPVQAGMMELVVNDFRTSFFGASPAYPEFRPLDLDDDGIVRCSVYKNGMAPAQNPAPGSYDEMETGPGRGPLIDPETGEPFERFSLTGYFTFQKSRFYRLFYRGEVYDVIRGVVVAQTNGEAVYVVDPDGDMAGARMQDPDGDATTGSLADSYLMYKHYHLNNYRGELANVEE